LDFEDETIRLLQAGAPPVHETGLKELIGAGFTQGQLSYTSDAEAAMRDIDVLWITYDTPVDEADVADVGYVIDRIERMFPLIGPGNLVLISSQIPVGTTRRLEQAYSTFRKSSGLPDSQVGFAYSPENLRLGKAIDAFMHPDRVVVGCRRVSDRSTLEALLQPITARIAWMSVESAEMTKHAINAFLATSVAFTNELSAICEAVGADAREVEVGLRTEGRIGPKAYLTPGVAYAGGTLARDIGFLTGLGAKHGIPAHLLAGVRESNDAHKGWLRNKLRGFLGELRGRRIAIWGLTYKPGTDTLRRSGSIELCRWLIDEGASVQAHDPAMSQLPSDLREEMQLAASPLEAASGAEALIVATEWPEYRSIDAASIIAAMAGGRIVLDPNRFLADTVGRIDSLRYISVGVPAGQPFEIEGYR
jgi:UDPglucose 6-dehydrogenase